MGRSPYIIYKKFIKCNNTGTPFRLVRKAYYKDYSIYNLCESFMSIVNREWPNMRKTKM